MWHGKPTQSPFPRSAESEDLTLGTPLLVQTLHTWLKGKIPGVIRILFIIFCSWIRSIPFSHSVQKHTCAITNNSHSWNGNIFFFEMVVFEPGFEHLCPKSSINRFQHARHTHLACPTAWAKKKLERFFVQTASLVCEDTQRCHGNGWRISGEPIWVELKRNLSWKQKESLFLQQCETNLGFLGFTFFTYSNPFGEQVWSFLAVLMKLKKLAYAWITHGFGSNKGYTYHKTISLKRTGVPKL